MWLEAGLNWFNCKRSQKDNWWLQKICKACLSKKSTIQSADWEMAPAGIPLFWCGRFRKQTVSSDSSFLIDFSYTVIAEQNEQLLICKTVMLQNSMWKTYRKNYECEACRVATEPQRHAVHIDGVFYWWNRVSELLSEAAMKHDEFFFIKKFRDSRKIFNFIDSWPQIGTKGSFFYRSFRKYIGMRKMLSK